MINVKLFVILIFIAVTSNASEYCQICRNHTLCKYPTPGPSRFCAGYDPTALLTRDGIVDIVNRINDKRNFVALGLSKNFPQAANMIKINWSEDLAWSAQRWADQCDPNVRPDKEDQCRDLAFVPVGQNIATITGPSPGLSTKSFIDMWYMQSMDYDGSVSYYNVSRDSKTNYLTQFIWAEVDIVGCGKARFYINPNTIVERLVCNFAPRGNIHGKPVYAIGHPATQCPADFAPDGKYSGLCTRHTHKEEKSYTPESLPETIVPLLRILNLSNSSKDIDPLNNKVKQSKLVDDRHQKSRHIVNNSFDNVPRFLPHPMQWYNHNHSTMFPINQQQRYHQQHQVQHQGQHPVQHQHQVSRAYHGHDHGQNFQPPFMGNIQNPNFAQFPVTAEQNFRRFDRFEMITQTPTQTPGVPPDPEANTNFRRNFPVPLVGAAVNYQINPYFQCSRQYPMPLLYNQPPPPIPRGAEACAPHTHGCGVTPPLCPMSLIPPPPPPMPCGGCSCGPPPPPLPPPLPPPPPPPCPSVLPAPPIPPPPLPLPNPEPCCNLSPPCLYRPPCGSVLPAPCYRRSDDQNQIQPKEAFRKSGSDLHYYDLFPNVVMRSGDSSEKPSSKHITPKNSWLPYNPALKKDKQAHLYKTQEVMKNLEHEKNEFEYPKHLEQELDYAYSLHDSRKRLRRENDDLWKIYDSSYHKTLRFTTLPQRRQKSRNTAATRSEKMESITISTNINEVGEQNVLRTEKYLSFNDLMHLRKSSAGSLSARRKGNLRNKGAPAKAPVTTKAAAAKTAATKAAASKAAATTKAAAATKAAATTKAKAATKSHTTEAVTTPPINYTTSAPFVRKRYCTRKMTCTWTAVTNAAGEKISGAGPIHGGGSRTPPGYVEGCTRTSTCTRDYLNRNKISTLPPTKYPGQDGEAGEEEDEDYCEKRSLDVRKRNLNENYEDTCLRSQESDTAINSTYTNQTTEDTNDECNCAIDSAKKKRDVNNNNINPLQNSQCNNYCNHGQESNYHNPLMSYGDIYYTVISKILKSWEEKKSLHLKNCLCNAGCNIKHNSMMFYSTFVFLSVTLLSDNCFL